MEGKKKVATKKMMPIMKAPINQEANVAKPVPPQALQQQPKIQIPKQIVNQVKPKPPVQVAPPKQLVNKPIPPKNIQKPIVQNKEPKCSLRILNDKVEDREKQLVAIIVTFSHSASYDPLFSTVQQKAMEGTRVDVYLCDSLCINEVASAIAGQPKNQAGVRLSASIKEVEPDCVVFNWECCQCYAHKKFPEGKQKLFPFVKGAIQRGNMCMFSDFSLKALITQWDQQSGLGPNPFVITGQFQGQFQIRFNNEVLKACPSAQLQIVGDMAEQGHCNMHALGQTIQYCVDNTKTQHDQYVLQVLTVVPQIKPKKPEYISQVGEHKGSAGHVFLKYPTGGLLLVSMGHWVELMKIDTSEKKLFEVAQRQFGLVESEKMKVEYQKLDVVSKRAYVSSKAMEFVKNQAPSMNMNKKKRM